MKNDRRWFAIIGLAIFFAGLIAPGAWISYVQALGSIDLSSQRDGSTIVVDREGRLLRAFTLPDGRWRLPVKSGEVDQRYIAMLLAYEDRRFYDHDGVDWRAMVRASFQMATRGRIVSGGSTLTMQVARLIEPREERSFSAKLRQVARPLQMESLVSKQGVLDRYLALAPFGGNIDSVTKTGDMSLRFKLKQPNASFLVSTIAKMELKLKTEFPTNADDSARV